MKYKIGDKVIYIKQSFEQYSWDLKKFEEYTVINRGFNNKGDDYLSIKWKDGTESSWYLEEDFITIKEYRKLKLKKINENTLYK